MHIPILENPAVSRVHLIGGEKGGVGKSMLARLLAQYFIDRGLPFSGFDTDRSHAALLRFYGQHASQTPIDRYEALDAIVETAVDHPGQRVLVDLAAQTHEPLLRWMDDSGVLDLADVSGIALYYWHVMDSGNDSIALLGQVLDRLGPRVRHVLVRNHLRGSDFSRLERSSEWHKAAALGVPVIDLRRLHEGVVQKIDASSAGFQTARSGGLPDGPGLRLLERQRLKLWLAHAFAEIEKVAP